MTKPEVILKVATDIERGKYKGTQLRFYLQRSPSETHKAYDMYHFVYFFSRTPSGLVEDLMRDVNQSGFDLEREWSLFGQNLVDGPTGIVNKDPETLEAMEAAHQMISLCPDSYRGSLENALYTRDIHTVIALAKNIPEIPIGIYKGYVDYVTKQKIPPSPADFSLTATTRRDDTILIDVNNDEEQILRRTSQSSIPKGDTTKVVSTKLVDLINRRCWSSQMLDDICKVKEYLSEQK